VLRFSLIPCNSSLILRLCLQAAARKLETLAAQEAAREAAALKSAEAAKKEEAEKKAAAEEQAAAAKQAEAERAAALRKEAAARQEELERNKQELASEAALLEQRRLEAEAAIARLAEAKAKLAEEEEKLAQEHARLEEERLKRVDDAKAVPEDATHSDVAGEQCQALKNTLKMCGLERYVICCAQAGPTVCNRSLSLSLDRYLPAFVREGYEDAKYLISIAQEHPTLAVHINAGEPILIGLLL